MAGSASDIRIDVTEWTEGLYVVRSGNQTLKVMIHRWQSYKLTVLFIYLMVPAIHLLRELFLCKHNISRNKHTPIHYPPNPKYWQTEHIIPTTSGIPRYNRKKVRPFRQKGRRQTTKRFYHFKKKAGGFLTHREWYFMERAILLYTNTLHKDSRYHDTTCHKRLQTKIHEWTIPLNMRNRTLPDTLLSHNTCHTDIQSEEQKQETKQTGLNTLY